MFRKIDLVMTREEALQNIKKVLGFSNTLDESIFTLFPELKGREDEKIRKRIRLCLDECVHSDIIRDYERDECLAYLEKQKEPKSAEWSEEDRDRVAQYLHDRDGGMLWSKAKEITSDILDILHPQPRKEI